MLIRSDIIAYKEWGESRIDLLWEKDHHLTFSGRQDLQSNIDIPLAMLYIYKYDIQTKLKCQNFNAQELADNTLVVQIKKYYQLYVPGKVLHISLYINKSEAASN